MKKVVSFFITLFAFCIGIHYPCSALPLFASGGYSVELTTKNSESTITFKGFSEGSITVFDVDNPDRIVVDIAQTGIKLPKGTKTLADSCIRSVRFGAHADKTRIVLDRSDTACTHSEASSAKSFTIKVTPLNTVIPSPIPTAAPATPSPTTTPTVSPKASPTPIPTLIPTLTPAHTLTPSPTSTPTITPQPEQTPTTEPTQPSIETPTQQGKVLKEITFSHENDQTIVMLSLSERTNFKLTRENPREYKITITDCSVGQQGLTLPQFPPNDMVGFTLVKATPGENKLEITIGVDDGMKASAVNKDSMIIVRAEPSGF